MGISRDGEHARLIFRRGNRAAAIPYSPHYDRIARPFLPKEAVR
jgi:hypothetical protein